MFIYTETGILVEKIDFSDLAIKYDKPIEISENGLILIFSKGLDDDEIHLIQVHIDKLEHVTTINIKQRIQSYLNKMDRTSEVTKQMFEFWNDYLHKLTSMRKVRQSFFINDDAEILIRLHPVKVITL